MFSHPTVFKIEQYQDKFLCIVQFASRKYAFRYAYPTEQKANDVLGNLEKHFGFPSGIETDIKVNYFEFTKGTKFIFAQRTTQKDSFLVIAQ